MHYDPAVIEPKWQAVWTSRAPFHTPTEPAELAAKPKCYMLDMFPYPSRLPSASAANPTQCREPIEHG